MVASKQKIELMRIVETAAIQPRCSTTNTVVSSVAFEGLRRDYLRLCSGNAGGLVIVHDKRGMGKSRALQGVARARSQQQPPRFLVLNITTSTCTCAQLYDMIQSLIGVKGMGLAPFEVAEVIRHGLIGPVKSDGSSALSLPETENSCRIEVRSSVSTIEKKHNFPILVIDEFNPIDFDDQHWQHNTDYTLEEVKERMGEVLSFFGELAGKAHTQNGFVAFVGTRSKAVARALLKINEGTKAFLAPCTRQLGGDNGFTAWRGFEWTLEKKRDLLEKLYEVKYKNMVREFGFYDDNEVQAMWEDTVAVSVDAVDIRAMCDNMNEEIVGKKEAMQTLVQSRTQETDRGAGCMDLKMIWESLNCAAKQDV